MGFDQEYQKDLQKHSNLKQLLSNCKPLIVDLLRSSTMHTWSILNGMLNKLQKENIVALQQVRQCIFKNLRQIKSFPMLMLLFWYKDKNKIYLYESYSFWKDKYKQILEKNEHFLFSTWVRQQPSAVIVQKSLQLICSVFPLFFKQAFLYEISPDELQYAITWIAFFYTSDSSQYESVLKIIDLFKQRKVSYSYSYYSNRDQPSWQHIKIKKVMEVCSDEKKISSNLFLILYPFQFGEKDCSEFCYLNSEFILSLSEKSILNFFQALTKSSLRTPIIYLIHKISFLLKGEEEFYKLRYFYEQFILPYVVRRCKTCKHGSKQILQLSQFYILGFLKHTDIGEEGLECIVKNLQKIQNDKIKNRWIKLIQYIYIEHKYLEQKAIDLLQKQFAGYKLKEYLQKTLNDSKSQLFILSQSNQVWKISTRNSKKLKKYEKVNSKIRGITNAENDCYIISSIQALSKIGSFQKLISQCYQNGADKRGIISELNLLFQQLQGKRQAKAIKVTYLKERGHEKYRKSLDQEDAYQYLIDFFDYLQMQLKKYPLQLQKFKKTFQIKFKITTICSNCHNRTESEDISYAFSIPNTESLQKQTFETLPEFTCDKCKKNCQFQIIRRLEAKSQYLIVHINRFSHQKGKIKKQLSTQSIQRKFLDYCLTGMICHRGRMAENGHYIYYHKLAQKRWCIFNDRLVEQFQLENQEEEFEKENKIQMSPYILIYQKRKI